MCIGLLSVWVICASVVPGVFPKELDNLWLKFSLNSHLSAFIGLVEAKVEL